MRLLNADTLQLEYFEPPNLPRYAILSHTWGDQEVTFPDIQALQPEAPSDRSGIRLIKQKKGFEKILLCCKQARQDHLSHVWVDTCCIDKGSSAELSEAINSMFRYYKTAAVCYAYLGDVDVEGVAPRVNNIGYFQDNKKDFLFKAVSAIQKEEISKARWFTRGWTLQELIAPQEIKFYIKGWKWIGLKSNLSPMLSSITGVDEQALRGADLSLFSTARRMSWASSRSTTRIEDIAYSLLGIFDVHMPLIYGEGRKAFVRLQEEIMKDSEDQSLFAWTAIESVDLQLEPTLGQEGRSIFANHPEAFSHSREIRPSSFLGEPFAATNKGVRVTLPLVQMEGDLFIVVLECSREESSSEMVGMAVQKLPSTGEKLLAGRKVEQYVRHKYAALVPISLDLVREAEVHTMYICKRRPKYSAVSLATWLE